MRVLSATRLVPLVALLMIAAGTLACSLTQGDDDAPWDAPPIDVTATLSLHFDKEGGVDADLGLPDAPASWQEVRSTLGRALHCPGGRLNDPVGFGDTSAALPSTWTNAQRERYLAAMAKMSQKILAGTCPESLARHEGVLEGDIDYGPLAAQLAQAGVQQLDLFVALPPAEYRDYTKTGLRQFGGTDRTLMYIIPLDGTSPDHVLHLAFGFRPADVYRAFGILGGFFLIPLTFTLWMRRRALAAGLTDPIPARFGFFKTLNFLLTGSMLLWITSGLGSRQTLRDWIAQLSLPSWEAIAADVLILVGPSFLIYFLGIAVSYPVYAQVRQGGGWNRREYMVNQLATLGAWAVPLMMGLATMEVLREHLEVAIALSALTLVMLQVLLQLKLRVTKMFPQAVTTGELRDRVLALAGRMGVVVNKIFVLPAGKGQVANAYASKNKTVIFTDYLLANLTKREVDATAAHELAHLRHKHPTKRGVAFLAAIFLPCYFGWIWSAASSFVAIPLAWAAPVIGVRPQMQFFQAMEWFERWSQRDFVLIMLGLAGFYFLSRRFENQADETAVRVAGDPEAAITGLLKISRLNFMPIRWGKTSESWLTHPATVKRAERIAAFGGLAAERLQQILQQYDAHISSREVVAAPAAEDRYAVPAASDADRIRSAARDRVSRKLRAWALLAIHVLPLAVVSLAIRYSHLSGWISAAAYATGLLITAALVLLGGVWLSGMGRGGRKRRLLRRFAGERLPVGQEGDVLVGFAPEPYPRIYGAGDYHWDQGFLIFAKDRLQFVGEETRFALAAAEVQSVVLGTGGPSWWKFERIYVRWKERGGDHSGIFNLYPLEPAPMWKGRAHVRTLYQRLQAWREHPQQSPPVRPELANLEAPKLDQVSCLSPRKLGSLPVFLRVLGKLLLLALAAGVLLHATIWYLCEGVFALRLFISIPYWRYRDRPPAFATAGSGDVSTRALAASAVGQKSS